jgi:oxygen-independent coproporphyrinogen-3 oxidase
LIDYYAALDAGRLPIMRGLELNQDDVIRRELIGELMCHGMLDMSSFATRHGLVFDVYFAGELRRLKALAKDGLVTLDARFIRVTPRGRLLLRIIAMCFDAYLEEAQTASYSRAI